MPYTSPCSDVIAGSSYIGSTLSEGTADADADQW